MSFFDFNTAPPRGKAHNASAHGFGQTPDAFAGFSTGEYQEDEGEVLDFEDTYDGLGDELDDGDDAFNTDTFGAGPVGKDFDFAAQTGNVKSSAPQPPPQQPRQPQLSQSQQYGFGAFEKPSRSGYERYREPDAIPRLEKSASIWGTQPQQATQTPQYRQFQPPPPQPQHLPETVRPQQQPQQQSESLSIANVTRKMMSLEEVEAMMRAQSKKPSPAPQPVSQPIPNPEPSPRPPVSQPQILQRPQPLPEPPRGSSAPMPTPQILQRPQPPREQPLQSIPAPQNPQIAIMQPSGPSYDGRTLDEQIASMTEQQRANLMEEEARRAKRNHKILQLSKDNGLMTPQDKNFITRIQLQQLLTATGGVEDSSPEASLAEDFYYQVYSQIRGRINSNQPLSQFAQTYLHQTAGRTGGRRFVRGGDQIRRMEQQVQRAVEAAKLKPKNTQLVIEGSLGKISFSNAKTPKPLLNIRREEKERREYKHKAGDEKTALRNIEDVYLALMRMEDHERRMPPQTTEDSSADEIQEQIDWRATVQELNAALWTSLKVMEPIDPNVHPFIAILSHPKGKKVIPRVFRQIDEQQRLTILTMVVINLDSLDVVRQASPLPDIPLPQKIRDAIELFSQTILHCLFSYIGEASLGIIVGAVGLILDRVNVPLVVRTKAGLGLLTMFLSRAELIKQGGNVDPKDVDGYSKAYNDLFDRVEPVLPHLFTTPIATGDDVYVWQFLAALGVGANLDQQQRLVIGVKDRVMDSIAYANGLPGGSGKSRLDDVNLFMVAIGLDVALLS